MPQTHRISVTSRQWDEAAEQYELGTKHAAQISRELGVSPATVSREFKRRGCIKASRVGEVVAELVAKLDAEAKEKARRREAEAAARAAAMDALVGELMDAIVAADKAGDLTMANPEIARIDRALQLAMR
jgi:IS30 family transposase